MSSATAPDWLSNDWPLFLIGNRKTCALLSKLNSFASVSSLETCSCCSLLYDAKAVKRRRDKGKVEGNEIKLNWVKCYFFFNEKKIWINRSENFDCLNWFSFLKFIRTTITIKNLFSQLSNELLSTLYICWLGYMSGERKMIFFRKIIFCSEDKIARNL